MDVRAGPVKNPQHVMAEIVVTVTDTQGWTAHEVLSVAVAPQFLHNLGGIAADETSRAVATLIREIGVASGKRSRPVQVEELDGAGSGPGSAAGSVAAS